MLLFSDVPRLISRGPIEARRSSRRRGPCRKFRSATDRSRPQPSTRGGGVFSPDFPDDRGRLAGIRIPGLLGAQARRMADPSLRIPDTKTTLTQSRACKRC